MIKYNYFDTKHAIEVHASIIEKSGGLAGVKNEGSLDSVLAQISDEGYYPDFLDKITNLVYGINKNHCFNDGNKRASIALSCYFLELNGHDYVINQYTQGMEEIAVWLASSLINKEQLKEVIQFLLYEDWLNIALFTEGCKQIRVLVEKTLISKELIAKILNELLQGNEELSYEVQLELLDIYTENWSNILND